ncbi:TPA: assimilatory sulfite reductase (NADPH) flavoprotein subunit [Neisseria meningitidis]
MSEHDMQNTNPPLPPLPPEITQLLSGLDAAQWAWLSGYAWAKAGNGASAGLPALQTALPTAEPFSVTVLSASQTGNAKSVADKAADSLEAAGIQVSRTELKDYKAKNIADERRLLLVTSTQGEGEPPEEAVVLHKLLNGKKAPKLDKLQFAVLGLGDSSYPNFCQAGKDFDRRFEELGAKRLLERVDADLDFTASADGWTGRIVARLKEEAAKNRATPAPQTTPPAGLQTAPDGRYCKAAPFPAALLANQKITARQSDKDVRHIEIDLSGSDLHYLPGDALGVWFDNDPALVREILDLLGIDPATEIQAGGKMMPVARALSSHFELTQNTPAFVKGYAAFAHYEELDKIIADNAVLQDFVQNTPIVDVLHRFPASLTAEQFIRLLRPLAPRLYSISSAQAEVGDEVHLTVGVVRFEHEGRARTGGASGFLADRLEEDGTVRVFVERNDGFRLPEDSRKPIVMIGSGTGVAPFRAFVQQRAAENAEGKNWLIFGNPHFARDFLYQTEWQQFAKDGFLHRYDFAWSRDQEEKIYVQDKIREQAEGLWQWLQEGAHIYVCGDAAKMAKDVEAALLDVIIGAGHLDEEGAEEYLDMLREEKRYQRDVY